MIQLRNIGLLLVFIFSALLMQYCNKCKGGYHRTKITIYGFTFTGPFKSKAKRLFLPNDSIPMLQGDTLHFGLIAKKTVVSSEELTARSEGNLYACKELQQIYERAEQDSLKVITLNDFDNLHPAGSNISEFFLVSGYDADTLGYYPIKDYGLFRENLFKYDPTYNTYSPNFTLTLLKKPDNVALNLKLLFFNKVLTDSFSTISPIFTFKK